MTTAQEASDQTHPLARGSSHETSSLLRVVRDELLVAFIDLPGNIRRVPVAKQRDPVLAVAPQASALVGDAVDDPRARDGAAERVGASIDGIAQQVADGVVHGQAPGQPDAPRRVAIVDGQRQAGVPEPLDRAVDTAELGKLVEDEAEGVLDAGVGMLVHLAIVGPHVSRR